ncbi:MAG: NPCBM/NEW2 domain-containing protein [Armatimonadetes bacterium]|nr:NPCBM/NEW2 domain-containing protein [Armatimonadota bacterium]
MNNTKFSTFLTLLAFSVLASAGIDSKDEIRLVDLQATSYTGGYTIKSLSMGGKAYDYGLFVPNMGDSKITFRIPEKVESLKFDVGVNDRSKPYKGSPSIRVLVDGDEVTCPSLPGGELEYSQKPVPWTINLIGKKSIQICLTHSAGIGEPRFTKAPKVTPQQTSPNVARLISPSDKAVVSGDTALLRWEPVAEAISYGVTITSLKMADPVTATTPRIWCGTVLDTKFSFSLKDVPAGEYLWSVVAFGDKKALGGYSEERILVVEK